jgi:hypothetical protein
MTKAKAKARRKSGKPHVPVIDTDHRKPDRAEPADRVALEARARQTGLTVEQSKDQRAATWYGQLAIRGQLSTPQFEGLERLRALKNKYRSVMGIPGRDTDGSTGDGGEIDPAYVTAIKDAHSDAMAELQDIQNKTRAANIPAIVDLVVMRGERHDHMLAGVVMVATWAAKHFGTEARRAA